MARIISFAFSSCVSLVLLVIVIRGYSTLPTDIAELRKNTEVVAATEAVESATTTDIVEVASLRPKRPINQRSHPSPIEVTARQFDRLVWERGLVLVKFGADWCGPCRKVEAELDQLAADNAGRLTVLTVDVDKEPKLADKHNVGSIPRLLLFRNGVQIDHWTGFQSAQQMQTGIDKAIDAEPKGKIQANPFSI